MSVDFVGKAIEVARKATEADNAGQLDDAYKHYINAVEYFTYAIKYEKNERTKKSINDKATEYIERAEQLKKHLAQNNSRSSKSTPVGNDGTAARNDDDSDDKNEKCDSETKKMRDALQGAILQEKPDVHWSDIAGLDGAKEALKEAVILPIKFPQLFTGRRTPWKGILLYGPPGTGKSYLAKAVATEANSTFFSVSSSDLVSKWMGESERLVKQLFTLARKSKPAIIFIDEIDSLCGSRDQGESEASRRIKTELLVQMQGVGTDMQGVLVLGATNTPWQLDPAVRRRFEKRIYIPLPEINARSKMLELNIGDTPCSLTSTDYLEIAKRTEGYSGSDMAVLVRDALMEPVRKVQLATHFKPVEEGRWVPCSPGDEGAVEKTWEDLGPEELSEPDVSIMDFMKACSIAKGSVSEEDVKRYTEWTSEFGQEG